MTTLRSILAWFVRQLKIPFSWLSLVFGASLTLVCYQVILIKLWPFESLRLKLSSLLLLILFSAVCYWLLVRFLPQRLGNLPRPQRTAALFSSAILPLVLALAIARPVELSKNQVYFLLPSHNVEVRVHASSLEKDEEVILKQFSNQLQGDMSFHVLKVKGWERRDKWLYLTDPVDNTISWTGKTGHDATLGFNSPSGPVEVIVSWDGVSETYDLVTEDGQDKTFTARFNVPFYSGWLPFILALYLSTVLFALVLMAGLSAFGGLNTRPVHRRWAWLGFAAPMVLVWSIYLLTFFPGFLSIDSINQWEQMVTGEYLNWHPVANTLLIWLITRVWYSPAAVAATQILVLAGVLGWGIASLRESGMPGWMGWLLSVFLALNPANGALSITLWKDVLFSAVLVALTVQVLKVVLSRGAWLQGRFAWFSLGLILALVSLGRQNGVIVALPTLLVLIWVYKSHWRVLAKAALLFLGVYFLFTGPVFRWLDVQTPGKARVQVVIADLIAGHMDSETPFAEEDWALLAPAFPTRLWPYNCHRNSGLIFSPDLDRKYLTAHTSEILDIALRATWQNPVITLKHFTCQGAFVYRIPQDYPIYETISPGISENPYGIKEKSLLPALRRPLRRFLDLSSSDMQWSWLLWRMPFWMYLCIFGCAVYSIRMRTWLPLLILIPGLLTVLPYIILSLGQIFRYVYGMYLIGILLSAYFWFCRYPGLPQPMQE